ncbi:MAG TPA: toxin-antitoxin system HicB family antitoxin [Solirubrobacteraceae bacterium]|nr:toxin-antitoxin system HicB family antitoxin [Solirubrobacteraceae bacterium]
MERLRAAIMNWLADEREDPGAMPQSTRRETATPDANGAQTRHKTPASHSGRFLVRMPSSLHEELARAAERENVSLNRFVTDALAATVSGSSGTPKSEDAADPGSAPPAPARPPARTVRAVLAANLVVLLFAAAVAIVLLVLALQRGI